MSMTLLGVLALSTLMALPIVATAQTDTSRRRDTARVARTTTEARGQIDLSLFGGRFRGDLPNHGLASDQAVELQQALTRVGCDVGTVDGIIGQRTVRALDCFRAQQNLAAADLETVFTALNLSFARPSAPTTSPPVSASQPQRDTTVLPPVIRPDTTYRADVRARRDSALKRDSVLRQDSLRRDTTTRRDTTARRDTTTRRDPP